MNRKNKAQKYYNPFINKKIYQKYLHGISQDQIDSEVLSIISTLKQAHHVACVVGGSIRDLLINKKPKDFDISTSATPEEIKKLFPQCFLIGRRFRLALIQTKIKTVEVSTFRKGNNEQDSLITRDNEWGAEKEDALRRDFTMNGLFYDPTEEIIIDYVNGYEDIKDQCLRTIGPPIIRFKQDPVRMIRLLKFLARFNFSIDQETLDAIFTCRYEILKSSSTRVLEEIFYMLQSGFSCSFIQYLHQYGFLFPLMPGISRYFERFDLVKEQQALLHAIDQHLFLNDHLLPRPFLISALIFPFFHSYIKKIRKRHMEPLSLEKIQKITKIFLKEAFSPFLKLPKKCTFQIINILLAQYQFTSPDDKESIKYQICRLQEFPLSLNLLKLREKSNPRLSSVYHKWAFSWNKRRVTQKKHKHDILIT